MHIQQSRGSGGTLKKATNANKVPALTMVHRRVSDTLKKMHPLLHAGKKQVQFSMPASLHTRMLDLKKEAIELLPHFGTDLLTHLPGILSCRGNARHNGGGVGGIKRQSLNNPMCIVCFIHYR